MDKTEILVVDDDPFQAELLSHFLAKAMDQVVVIKPHGQAALDYLRDHRARVDMVFMDIQMPVMDGITAMEKIGPLYPDLPVIFLSASKDKEVANKVMQSGAFDFLTKPFNGERILVTWRNARKYREAAQTAERARWSSNGLLHLHDLIGAEQDLRPIIEMAQKIASTSVPVLITGETGTGKDVLARAVHGDSPRARSPFVAINCGAIPENLIESILFGHEKGAFTGATAKTAGKFREAHGGTIFLDEVGEMPMAAQVRLLRVLQQNEVQPVGAAQPVSIDVRIISATNKDLARAVSQGHFREDLYFRLNVVPLHLPPLRVRPHDIVPLARHFIDRFCHLEGYRHRVLSLEAEEALKTHRWPGNVRELENVIRRALVLTDGTMLEPQDLALTSIASSLQQQEESFIGPVPDFIAGGVMRIDLVDGAGMVRPFSELEQDLIMRVYRYFDGNIVATSRALGIARTTLYRKLNRANNM